MHLRLWAVMLVATATPGCHSMSESGGAADARSDFGRGHLAVKTAGLRPINSMLVFSRIPESVLMRREESRPGAVIVIA